MSSYFAPAFHPDERVVRNAFWVDDHFGRYEYGIKFDKDGPVFRTSQVVIPNDVVFVPETEVAKARAAAFREAAEMAEQFGNNHVVHDLLNRTTFTRRVVNGYIKDTGRCISEDIRARAAEVESK